MKDILLTVSNLQIIIDSMMGTINPIRGINFSIHQQETFAIVGESGSGKSLTALSILRLLPHNARILQGSEIKLSRESLLKLSEIEMRRVRAQRLGFIFQDPMSALNPVMRIKTQLIECFNSNQERIDVRKKIYTMLEHVRIADVDHCLKSYPHQLSGGMKQRIMIAMALAKSPDLLIADEPTTALDVTTQAQVLNLIHSLKEEIGMSVLLITHDFGVVAQMADRVAVMNQGEIVETAHREKLFRAPEHPYTQKLLNALPEKLVKSKEVDQTSTIISTPILKVNDLKVNFNSVKAVDGVSFELGSGQTLCLVGESGCGKTTTGKAILRLIDPASGEIMFQNTDLAHLTHRGMTPYRRAVQMVFQDPFASMDPRMRIREVLLEGVNALHLFTNKSEKENWIDMLLEQVGLDITMKHRYPHEFSGGQRQRIAIARALSVNPKLIVCDEPTSSLDVSIQAQILQLLKTLQRAMNLSYVFITHNIGVVKVLADYVAVMYLGRIVEYGTVDEVLMSPKHPYTQALLAAVPSVVNPQPLQAIQGDIPSPRNPPNGCHFAPRCPHAFEQCVVYPPIYKLTQSHQVKCYLYENLMESNVPSYDLAQN
ncbi:MAG: dipeptide ABC transporter ATP-binding protein [Gammaproteobacteria bacterium]